MALRAHTKTRMPATELAQDVVGDFFQRVFHDVV
jgi:hypothetical protein